ncbi:MAG: hypothetical protein RLZ36_626 [Pseudomonadota bacterium]
MAVLGLIAGMSICIGLVFWVMGAPLILPFALIESLLLVVAFVCHAKAVCDFDEITLTDRHLVVRQERLGQTKEHQFTRGLFRVSMTDGPSPLVRVVESGRRVELGEWLLPQERQLLRQRLSDALMASPAGAREAL